MKSRVAIALAACVVWAFAGDGLAKRPVTVDIGGNEAKVSFLEGTAEAMKSGEQTWTALCAGDLVGPGGEIRTGPDSRMEILLKDGSILRFADKTRLKLAALAVDEDAGTREVKVDVLLGRTWANVSRTLGVQSGFEIASENAVAGARGTIYRMNVYEDQSALVRVYDGSVAVSRPPQPVAPPFAPVGPPTKVEGPKPVPGPTKVSMEEWVFIVKSMQQIRIGADGVAEEPREFTTAEDKNDWVDWNKERDARIEEKPGEPPK